jgi:hypothetical protein
MTVVNYHTKTDPIAGVSSRVAKIEKIFRSLKFWEVNDNQLGADVLKRRKVSPSLAVGTVGKGPWFDVTGVNGTTGTGSGSTGLDLTKCALGYKIDPAGDDHDLVRIYAGEIDRIAVAQTDVTVANNDYIYVRRTIADDTMDVLAGASVPANGATYIYFRLYRFTVTAGVATILNIFRPFDVEVNRSDTIPGGGVRYQVLQRNAVLAPVWDWVRWV